MDRVSFVDIRKWQDYKKKKDSYGYDLAWEVSFEKKCKHTRKHT